MESDCNQNHGIEQLRPSSQFPGFVADYPPPRMAENTVTPKSENSTELKAPVDPIVAKAPVEAKPDAPVAAPVIPAAKIEPEAVKPAEPVKIEAKVEPNIEAAKHIEGIPEAYDIKLEGDITINQVAIAALTPALKEAGLTNAAATKLIGDYAKFQLAQPALKNAADLEVIRKDPELGQLNFGRTQSQINEALAAFTTPEERATLSSIGMANDPILVRMFTRIGRAMAEAPQTDAGPRAPVEKTITQRLYGGGDRVEHKSK